MRRTDSDEANDRQNDPPPDAECESENHLLRSRTYEFCTGDNILTPDEFLEAVEKSGVTRDEFLKILEDEVNSKEWKQISARYAVRIGDKVEIAIIKREESEKPPKLADSIICLLLDGDESLVILGDLTEDYKQLRTERGVEVANRWYWRQALSAVWPVLQRLIIRLATYAGVGEVVRRIIG
jgi:hypothetical protein